AHLPHQPFGDAVALELVGRQELAGLLGEIEQDRARLHQAEIVVAIDDRRDAVVRADLEELGLELLVLADVDRVGLVRDADLLQHDGGLAAVRGRPGVKIDHESPLGVAKSAGNALSWRVSGGGRFADAGRAPLPVAGGTGRVLGEARRIGKGPGETSMAEGASKVVRTLHVRFTLPGADPAQLSVMMKSAQP